MTISPWIFHKCTCNINSVCHDNVIKWTHLPRYWPFVRGIHRSPVDSTHRGQWRGALMFSLICARTRCFLWFAPEQKVQETIETAVIYYDVTVVVWPIYVNSLRAELYAARLCFYQTRLAWSMNQGSNKKHSAVHNFAPTVTKFCVMWEGQALPHDTKFSNCRCEIVGRRVIFIWSLIPGSSWSGLIKAEPECHTYDNQILLCMCWVILKAHT